jgi:hypothetical protein
MFRLVRGGWASLAGLTLVLTMAAPAAADGGGERYTIMVAGTLAASGVG